MPASGKVSPADPISGRAPRDPEHGEAAGAQRRAQLSAATTLGPVHLTVSELERSLDYYTRVVGLEAFDRADGRASLGVGKGQLLMLVEEPGARPAYGYTGLYHLALLVPSRADLARWLAHAARDRIPLVGLSDHFVSESIYLSDPDGHGIEIYSDRPRAVWEGQVAERMTTRPLDVDSLLGELGAPAPEPFDLLPQGTAMGHVHFKVAAIPETVAFYRDVLGFALTAQLGMQAAFLSVGGYHHHIGANTWDSAGATAPPKGTAALRHTTIVLPDTDERDRVVGRLQEMPRSVDQSDAGVEVRDPSGNLLLLTVA
jgi:catechol 2,3-dioxygenase